MPLLTPKQSKMTLPTRLPCLLSTALLAALLGACAGPSATTRGASPDAGTGTDAARTIGLDATSAIADASIADILGWLEQGQTTSSALVAAYVARIETYDKPHDGRPGLASVIAVNPEALALARKLDAERAAGRLRGPLHGVPILIKDNIGTVDMPTTNGSVAFATYRTHQDATVTKRLREAGAIIIAKANLSEFAWTSVNSESSLRGQARNPYDPSRTTTGSSGGSASAVAAGFAPASLGSDTSGSIRNPANHQALVGLRPTHGLVSLAGVTAQVSVMDTVGPMTRTVRDTALLLDVLAGSDPRDAYTAGSDAHRPASYAGALRDDALQGARIGVVTNPRYWGEGKDYGKRAGEHQQVVALVRQAVADLKRQGATVVEIEVPEQLSGRRWQSERYWMDRFLAREPADWPQGLAALTAPADVLSVSDYLKDGRAIESIQSSEQHLLTQKDPDAAALAADDARMAQGRVVLQQLFERNNITALVYPTDAMAAIPLDELGSYHNATLGVAPGLGAPAITVPAGFTREGLPAGLQFMGLPFSEPQLLALAHAYEQATHHRRAPVMAAPARVAGAPHR